MDLTHENIGHIEPMVSVVDINGEAARAQVLEIMAPGNTHKLNVAMTEARFDWTPDADRTDPNMPKFSKRLSKFLKDSGWSFANDRVAQAAEVINAPRHSGKLLVDSSPCADPVRNVYEPGSTSTCMYANDNRLSHWGLLADLGVHFVRVYYEEELQVPGAKSEIVQLFKPNKMPFAYDGKFWTAAGRFILWPVRIGDVTFPCIFNVYGITQETAMEIVSAMRGYGGWTRTSFNASYTATLPSGGDRFYTNAGAYIPIEYEHHVRSSGLRFSIPSRRRTVVSGEQVWEFQAEAKFGRWYLKGQAPEGELCPECGREKEIGSACIYCNVSESPLIKGLFDALRQLQEEIE